MYEKKVILKNLLKKYNKQFISVVSNLDREKSGSVSSCNFQIIFDLAKDTVLIEDIITDENISLYYEFIKKEDINKHQADILACVLSTRRVKAIRELNIPNKDYSSIIKIDYFEFICDFNTKGYCDIEQMIFGIKDTLKPINEYIAEIKKSEQYIALMSKK